MPDQPDKPRLRPNIRPFDDRADVLSGTLGEQHRHAIARGALVYELSTRMKTFWQGWCTGGRIGAVNAAAIAALDQLAQAAGLDDRGALWQTEAYRPRWEAICTDWAETVVPLIDTPDPDVRNLSATAEVIYMARRWAWALFIPSVWVAIELQHQLLIQLALYVTRRPIAVGYAVDPAEPVTLNVRTQPGESEAAFVTRAKAERRRLALQSTPSRTPKKDHAYIARNVQWLVRLRLREPGVSYRSLAREYDPRGDARKYVRDGVELADRWLNAVSPETKDPGDELLRELWPRIVNDPKAQAQLKLLFESKTLTEYERRRVPQPPPKPSSPRTRKRRAARAQRKRNRG